MHTIEDDDDDKEDEVDNLNPIEVKEDELSHEQALVNSRPQLPTPRRQKPKIKTYDNQNYLDVSFNFVDIRLYS